MKKQAWDSQLIQTNAAEPVSPKEGAQQCSTARWGGCTLLSGLTPAEGMGFDNQSICLNSSPHKKGLMEPQFPHLLHISNAHYATTGSVGAKGKPAALQAPLMRYRVLIPWQWAV